MNTAIFWRLVWKEYRQQRALWTAIALAGLIFQIAVLVYCVLSGVSELPDKLFTVALSVPILYSLGCGATLFAGEHEAETFPFQQALPVAAGRVFTAKFAFALLSALALFLFAFGTNQGPRWEAIFVLLPFLSTVLGASMFWADQQGQQYRFFTEHGVGPRSVWLSRQFVRGAVLAGIAAMASITLLFEFPRGHELPSAALGLAVLMFAAGQVCSIFIRSGIVAVFSAVLCSVLLFGWTMFLHKLGVWWVVSSLPLPFIFWWATWLYAPQWIQERTAWRVRIVAAISIVVPLLAVVAATAAYRVNEIPAIVPSFDTSIAQTPVTPEARKTAQMYSEASALLWNKVSVDANDCYTITSRDAEWQRGIELFVSASKVDECHFPGYSDPPRDMPLYLNELSNAVLAEARRLTSEGSLDASEELYESLLRYLAHLYAQRSAMLYATHGGTAEIKVWDELPHWAVHPDQDPDRILKMLNTIQEFGTHNSPNWRLGLLEEHVLHKRAAAMDDQVLSNYYGIDRIATRNVFKVVGTLMPWERWRISRLADVVTETKIEQLAGLDAPLAPGRYPNSVQPKAEFTLTTRTGARIVVGEEALEAWLRTTPLLLPSFTGANYGRSFGHTTAHRSAVQTQLALIAWRTEHGQLPESLAPLLGSPFETLPLDPYTDRPFVYFPDGIEEEIWDDGGMGMAMFGMGGMLVEEVTPTKPKLVRSEPFIWSPGEQISYVPGTAHSPWDSPTAEDFRDQQGNALSDQSLLHQGVQYPIPPADQQPSDPADNAAALPKAE